MKADCRVDMFLQYQLRSLARHLFDLYPAFGTDHHNRLVFSPIEDDSEIELAGQVQPFFNQDLTDKATRRSGLRRHQAAAKYLTRIIFRLLG